jgi:hypothetical protein
VCEAHETIDDGADSEANRPKGLGEERVEEEAMAGAEPEWMGEKRAAKKRDSLVEASLSLKILDTLPEEGRDGNVSFVPHTQYAESHCVQVCALAQLKGDQPDSVRFHLAGEQNLTL